MGVAVITSTSGSLAMPFGTGFSHELEALLHAEAMLLVDDDEAEIVKVDLLFDERVRADGEVGFAAKNTGACFAFAALIERARQQRDAIGLAGVRRRAFRRSSFGARRDKCCVARISVGAIIAA